MCASGERSRVGIASALVNKERERLRSEQLGRRNVKPIILLF